MTRRRGTRRALTALWALLGVVAAAILSGLPLYVFPAVDEPQESDAVLVLGPATFDRIRLGRTLIDDGYADTLVVSVSDPESDRSYIKKICDPGQADEVICFRPDPYTTQGESRALRDLSAERGWDSAIVITATPHISRSRLLFDRCVDSRVSFLASRGPRDLAGWAYQYAYQTGAYVKAFLTPGC